MHIQARSKTALSPADLARFLESLDPAVTGEAPINIEGVAGAHVEGDGMLAFSVEHGRTQSAHDLLVPYGCEWTNDLYAEEIPTAPDPNQPGVLLEIIRRASDSSEAAGRPIDHVLIGAKTGAPGTFYVQVTFEGSVWQTELPEDDDDDVADGPGNHPA